MKYKKLRKGTKLKIGDQGTVLKEANLQAEWNEFTKTSVGGGWTDFSDWAEAGQRVGDSMCDGFIFRRLVS